MAYVFFNNTERCGLPLPQVVEALQRLQDDPNQLADERDRRYNEPPPRYSQTPSGETTQPPTPGPPVADDSHQRFVQHRAKYKAVPLVQFKSQAARKIQRLEHQISHQRFDRRQTLPWDDGSDLRANSENNVRRRWVEQGIWADEWGLAWPKDSHPMTTKWTHKGDGPFFGSYNPTTAESKPGARWGHEKYDYDDSDPKPAPVPEVERRPEPEPEQQHPPLLFGLGVGPQQKPQPKPPREPYRYIQGPFGPVGQYPMPKPTVRDPEASRPCHQFQYQIAKEREWIKDEIDYKTPGRLVDLDAMAYESVKNNWIEDGIWNPEWNELPGMVWIHEELDEEVVEAPARTAHPPRGQQPDASNGNGHPPRRPRSPHLPEPAPLPQAPDGGSPAPAPGGAKVPDVKKQRRTSRGKRARVKAADAAQDQREARRRSLRSARPPEPQERDNLVTLVAQVGRQGRGDSSAAPAKIKSARGKVTGRLDREQGNQVDLASVSHRPKRRRGDVVEDEQPLKRPRHNAPRQASNAANTAANGVRTRGTRNTREARPLPDGGKTAPRSAGNGGTRTGVISIAPRRSARIAERQERLRAEAAVDLHHRRPRSPPTKAAKRGRPKRSDPRGTPKTRMGRRSG